MLYIHKHLKEVFIAAQDYIKGAYKTFFTCLFMVWAEKGYMLCFIFESSRDLEEAKICKFKFSS